MEFFVHPSEVFDRISSAEMLSIFQQEGFYAEEGEDGVGDPRISFKVEGIRCQVFFYDVEDGRASSLQFATAFDAKPGLEKVNAWNQKKRFLKTYLDDEGDLHMELDVDLDGGVTRGHLAEQIRLWRNSLLSCLRFMRRDDD